MQKPNVQKALRLAALVAVTVAAPTAAAASLQDNSTTTSGTKLLDSSPTVLPTGGARNLGLE
ncbi:hypothetical protein [Deinococcus yavapaiensis]|uniref:Secreted protein n=1 Tax=Deinococcus yavapaiensis KR-236 TaxID=694435 RepID=A0A318SDB5_9DEIO|nr:hypothetical protein [Deinococcus yavapaiensis]PYE54891.1 hypothetical protein DES52_104162 [Deinococcus yavapaiensis KR-236]